jgi:tetratricopeptide (TPR) repeat protein
MDQRVTGIVALKTQAAAQLAVLACSVALALPVLAQTSAKPLLDQASEAAFAGRNIDALAFYTQAIAAAPADPAAHVARARLFDQLESPDLAAADYRVAAKANASDATLQASLCLDLGLANHDLDGALAACNAAVKLTPGNADMLAVRGFVQLRRGAWVEAEKDYAAALQLAPADPNDNFGRGIALVHSGHAVDGRDQISIASLETPSLVSDWEARGFGSLGQILPGRPITTALQPAITVADQKLFLSTGESYVKLTNGCGMIVGGSATSGQSWSGACRFGLIHGDGKLTSSSGQATSRHFAYGREITGETGAAAERKLNLAYQAAEKALLP